MRKKGSLFQLIKSLSQTEKRYFRIYCNSQQESSNHLKLFDAIDKQEYFNDEEIKEQFKGAAFVNQLHVTKNYLQNLILKSLRNYHAKISKDAEIRNLIADAEILLNKELFDQCHYVLMRAEKMALRFENFVGLVEVYEYQRRLYTNKYGASSPLFKEIIKKQLAIIEELKVINKYWELIARVSGFEFHQNNEVLLQDDPWIKQTDSGSSLQAKALRYHVLYSDGLLNYQGASAEKYINQLIDLLEQHPDRIKNEPGLYVNALSNKIPILLHDKRWEEAFPILELIRKLPATYGISGNNKFSIRTKCRSYNLELEIYRDKKDVGRGIKLVKEVEQFMEKYERAIPEDYHLLFWNQFAHLYFLDKQYSSALVWVNKMIDIKTDTWNELVGYARILHLMLHFELGNMMFIRYAIDSHRRYFKNQKRMRPFEKSCLMFFTKIVNVTKAEHLSEFQNFYEQLFNSKEPIATANILDYVDIKSWVEGKVGSS